MKMLTKMENGLITLVIQLSHINVMTIHVMVGHMMPVLKLEIMQM